jgi:hypothetical protein
VKDSRATIVGAAATETKVGSPPPEPSRGARWAIATAGLDIFWVILAVVLVGAVVFVASVAHTSMDKVGTTALRIEAQHPKAVGTTANPTLVIVQVSSSTDRTGAQAAADELIARGFHAHVLQSDRYRPMNRGFYVVYTGPYPATTAGRAEAKRIQSRLPGALVRDIQAR